MFPNECYTNSVTLFGNFRTLVFVVFFHYLPPCQTISADVIKRKVFENKSLKKKNEKDPSHESGALSKDWSAHQISPVSTCLRKDMQQIILLVYKLSQTTPPP